MATDNQRHLPLTGAYNFRDLGGYRTRSGAVTKWRRILRADSPHRLSGQDMDMLVQVGLGTVIDLRSANEIKTAPNPFATHDRVSYHNIGLFDLLTPDMMQKDLPRGCDDPLFEFYIATLENRQVAIRDVLVAIAAAGDGAVMFHCTTGKDRTGLIAALLLGLAEVEEDEIVSDYAQTRALIADLVAEFLRLARENGTDLASYRRLLECNPDTMRKLVRHIRERYRSVPGFLAEIGLEPQFTTRLRRRLLW